MMASNIAPGMNRSFLAEDWKQLVPRKNWYDALEEAQDLVDTKLDLDLQGFDIDGDVVRNARENAACAGVDHLIHFQQREVAKLRHPKKYGFVITNPPYGERVYDKEEASICNKDTLVRVVTHTRQMKSRPPATPKAMWLWKTM